MWVLYAVGSAVFAGITSILAKMGLQKVDSYVATALRTIVVLVFAWIMAALSGALPTIGNIQKQTYVILVLSGVTTGASWLCYFRALQLGDVNKVVSIDKSSIILTMLMAFLFLKEPVSFPKLVGLVLIGAGTYLMIQKKQSDIQKSSNSYFIYAALSAIFAALTSILGKLGMQKIDSNLGTAIRTIVVLIMAWLIVFLLGKAGEEKKIDRKSWNYLILSGLATGASWLCYYRALKEGPASIVAPIDKLSILVSVGFAVVVLKEELSKKAMLGLIILTSGTLLMLL